MSSLDLQVPSAVAAAARGRWAHGDEWVNSVHAELKQLCAELHAQPTRVLPARYSFVVETKTSRGPIIIRGSADPMAKHQATVARALATLGVAPAIHAVTPTATGAWTVMDQVQPGTSLVDLPNHGHRISGFTDVLRVMVGQPAPSACLPRLTDWLEQRLCSVVLDDAAPSLGPPSDLERERATAALRDLNDDPAATRLCHGDTSWGNILLGHRDRLALIDPRGMSGDIAYDTAVFALKAGHLADAPKVAASLANSVGLDPDRVLAWLAIARAARV